MVFEKRKAWAYFLLLLLPAKPGETVYRDQEMETVVEAQQSFRILVMDDEQMVREVLGAMLDLLGHQVARILKEVRDPLRNDSH